MKVVVLSAPSGSGKTTIAQRLLQLEPALRFSTSATTRQPRETERDGEDYHFMSPAQFRRHIEAGEFVEWEEVYPGVLYGTLRSEIERVAAGGAALLDVDVKGALNVKRQFADQALTVFVRPPSLGILAERLQLRQTETSHSLAERLERARVEMEYADAFDVVVHNDDLERAVAETAAAVREFLTTGASPAAGRA